MTRSIRFAAFALSGLALFTCGDAVAAGTTMAADAFDSLYETVRYWTQGSLGKTISLCFLISGLGLGVIRGSIVSAVTCIAASLSLMIAPTILEAIFAR